MEIPQFPSARYVYKAFPLSILRFCPQTHGNCKILLPCHRDASSMNQYGTHRLPSALRSYPSCPARPSISCPPMWNGSGHTRGKQCPAASPHSLHTGLPYTAFCRPQAPAYICTSVPLLHLLQKWHRCRPRQDASSALRPHPSR